MQIAKWIALGAGQTLPVPSVLDVRLGTKKEKCAVHGQGYLVSCRLIGAGTIDPSTVACSNIRVLWFVMQRYDPSSSY